MNRLIPGIIAAAMATAAVERAPIPIPIAETKDVGSYKGTKVFKRSQKKKRKMRRRVA